MSQIKALLVYFLRFLALFSWSLNAESTLVRDMQTWVSLTTIGSIHSKDETLNHWRYWLEGQQRFGDDSSRFSQSLVRPGIGYTLTTNTSLWLGYAWIYTGLPFTTTAFEENRIWQQLLWIKTNRYVTVSSRTRTEQRFLETAHKTAYRIREQVKISVPLKEFSKFSFVSSNEIFWHKNNFVGRNSKGFDQNRLFVGLGYKANQTITAEMGYMNQYIRRFGVPNFLSNIVALNFFVNL